MFGIWKDVLELSDYTVYTWTLYDVTVCWHFQKPFPLSILRWSSGRNIIQKFRKQRPSHTHTHTKKSWERFNNQTGSVPTQWHKNALLVSSPPNKDLYSREEVCRSEVKEHMFQEEGFSTLNILLVWFLSVAQRQHDDGHRMLEAKDWNVFVLNVGPETINIIFYSWNSLARKKWLNWQLNWTLIKFTNLTVWSLRDPRQKNNILMVLEFVVLMW